MIERTHMGDNDIEDNKNNIDPDPEQSTVTLLWLTSGTCTIIFAVLVYAAIGSSLLQRAQEAHASMDKDYEKFRVEEKHYIEYLEANNQRWGITFGSAIQYVGLGQAPITVDILKALGDKRDKECKQRYMSLCPKYNIGAPGQYSLGSRLNQTQYATMVAMIRDDI